MYTVWEQFRLFAATMAAGALGGFFFDGYRSWRWLVRPGRWLTLLGDALFWLLGTAAVFALLLYLNGGEMRFYVLVALAAGLAVYLRWCSRAARRGWRLLWLALRKTWRWLLLGLAWPWLVAGWLLRWPLLLVFFLLRRMGRLVPRWRRPS